MSKEKTQIHYDIVGNKGFNFNSSTYNIMNKSNTFWTTSIPMSAAEIEIKFPAHILTQIEFKNSNSPSLEIEIFNINNEGIKKDNVICVKKINLFTKQNLQESYNVYTFNLSDNVSIPKIPYTYLKLKLFNPEFEEFQTNLGVCYLFLYGYPPNKPESHNNLLIPKKDSINKENFINPFKPQINSNSKDSDTFSSGKTSVERIPKSNNENIGKMIKERLSGVTDATVKTLFKDRSSTKEEKYISQIERK